MTLTPIQKQLRNDLRHLRKVRWILNAAPDPERLAKQRSGKLKGSTAPTFPAVTPRRAQDRLGSVS